MGPGSAGPPPLPGAPGGPQTVGSHVPSGPGIPASSKPGVMSNSSRPQSPHVSILFLCLLNENETFACII